MVTSTEEPPTLSVITPTLNCAALLYTCLSLLKAQDYPKEKIEYITADQGSTDGTLQVAQQFGARIISVPQYRGNMEAARAVALLASKNELVAIIDSDNFIESPTWLRQMVQPLMEDREIIATQTLRYGYRRTDSLLNRYYALLGGSDPVGYYLNKRDRISWAEDAWTLMGEAEDRGDYYIVRFPTQIPTLGSNGFLIRRDILLQADCQPEMFHHIDVLVDLSRLGLNTYGIVKNSVIHHTDRGFINSMKKKFRYMLAGTEGGAYGIKRRYQVFDPACRQDRVALAKYILYAATVVKPTFDAIRGFRKVPDTAWFMHPLVCLVTLLTYGLATVIIVVRRWRIRK